jgi:CHAT domain-containing protein
MFGISLRLMPFWIALYLPLFANTISKIESSSDLAAGLLASKTVEQRTRLLAENQSLVNEELQKTLITEGLKLSAKGEHQQALLILELSKDIAQRLNYTAGVGASWNAIGSTQRDKSDFDMALQSFAKAQSIGIELKDDGLISDSDYGIGRVHLLRGDILVALDFYQKSLESAEKLNDLKRIGKCWNSIGLVRYHRGEFEQARVALVKSLEIFRSLDDKLRMTFALTNLSNLYGDLGDLQTAIEYSNQCLQVQEEMGDDDGKAISLNNLGVIEWDRGNYVAALNLFQRSLEIQKNLKNTPAIARAFLNLANVHGAQGNQDVAMKYIHQAIDLLKKQPESIHMAQALVALGDAYFDKGDTARALRNYRAGLDLYRKTGEMLDVVELLARICQMEANTSLNACDESASLSEKLGPQRYSFALNASAAAYLQHGDFAKAISFAEHAAELARSTGSREVLQKALTLSGQAYMREKDLVKAESKFQEAIDTIDGLRGDIAGGEQEREKYFEKKLTAFDEMVELLVQQKRTAEALEYAERAKGRVLYDVLQQRRSQIAGKLSLDERQQEKQLREKLQTANLKIRFENEQEAPDEEQLKLLRADLEKQRIEYERYRTLLYASHPELRIQRAEFLPGFWKDLTRSLPQESAFLQYVITKNVTFLFLIHYDRPISVFRINLTEKKMSKLAEEFRQQVADRDPAFYSNAKNLYSLLVQPVETKLEGISSIVIIPDRELWEVPFQTLIDGNDKFLIEKFPISYSPSLAVFSEMQKLKQQLLQKQPAVLALGNPAFQVETKQAQATGLRNESLQSLPEAQKEVINIAALYDSQRSMVLIHDRAQEEVIKQKASEFEIIHLATHGVVNNASPMYSHLLLSHGIAEDGLLEAWEIMEMNLKARLIVLSACDTARGHIGPGEGVIGLSWALFIAGTPTALLSQWRVDSSSTTSFMMEFHKNFSVSKFSPDKAAQQAALQIMKTSEYSHPFYWAGFVVVGNGI